MNTNRIEMRVNGLKYQQKHFKYDFSDANEDYSNAYQQFLQLVYKHKNVVMATILKQ